MSNIGILTYHRSLNYGAVMQAHALAEQIKSHFPAVNVEIIDYSSVKMDRYYKMITAYRGRESAIHLLGRLEMYRAFQKGLRELPLSIKRLSSDSNVKFQKWLENKYDIIIVGSDAVWNYSKRGLPNPYFLTIPGKFKRLSYAASCNGLGISSFEEIGSEEREYLKQSFSNFDYLGVRDEQTRSFVNAICPHVSVYHNCDPSLLLRDLRLKDRQALLEKLGRKYGFDPKKPAIGIMMSNHNGKLRNELVQRIKQKYGDKYQTVSVYSYNKYADIPYVSDLTPQEWSIIFGLFDLTISKYYHGVMFSLLNRTPVIAVSAEKSIQGLPNKVSDALEKMNMEDLYFNCNINKPINWEGITRKIDECLSNDQTDRISDGIEKEIKSSESFFEKLAELI